MNISPALLNELGSVMGKEVEIFLAGQASFETEIDGIRFIINIGPLPGASNAGPSIRITQGQEPEPQNGGNDEKSKPESTHVFIPSHLKPPWADRIYVDEEGFPGAGEDDVREGFPGAGEDDTRER